MQAKGPIRAMMEHAEKRRTGALVAIALAALTIGALPVAAGQRTVNAGPCAQFGPGFVAVTGSATCVRISGQMRVEYSFGQNDGLGGMGGTTTTGSLAPPPLVQQQIADPAPPYQRLRPVGMKSVEFKSRQQRKVFKQRHLPDAH